MNVANDYQHSHNYFVFVGNWHSVLYRAPNQRLEHYVAEEVHIGEIQNLCNVIKLFTLVQRNGGIPCNVI